MNYQRFFEEAIDQIHAERRYRVFADLERIAGSFPRAIWRSNGKAEEITVWCSNDYLGMGQHPAVVEAMQAEVEATGAGAGLHAESIAALATETDIDALTPRSVHALFVALGAVDSPSPKAMPSMCGR